MIIRLVSLQFFSISNLLSAKTGRGKSMVVGALVNLGLVIASVNAAQAADTQAANTKASLPAPLSEQATASNDEEPSAVVATMFDKAITAKDITPDDKVLAEMASQANSSDEQNAMMALASLTKLSELIIEGVLDDYFVHNNLVIDAALVEKFKAKFAASVKGDVISNDVAQRQVMIYLAEKHMYNTYGGKVVFRQSNPQLPVGAYYKILKNYEQAGKFTILDKSLNEGFWTPFTPPYQYELAKESIDFSEPWWL